LTHVTEGPDDSGEIWAAAGGRILQPYAICGRRSAGAGPDLSGARPGLIRRGGEAAESVAAAGDGPWHRKMAAPPLVAATGGKVQSLDREQKKTGAAVPRPSLVGSPGGRSAQIEKHGAIISLLRRVILSDN